MRFLITMLFGLSLLAYQKTPPKPHLPSVLDSKELLVVTYASPSTYYVDGQQQPAGLEYDLVTAFANYLGKDIKVKLIVVNNTSEAIPTILKGKAHFAAAGLSITPLRADKVRFGPAYQEVEQQLVYNAEKNALPKALIDLDGKSLAVAEGTSYAERLAKLRITNPTLHWDTLAIRSDDLMERVAEGTLDYTVVDSHIASMGQNLYPQLETAFNLGETDGLAWAFPRNGDDMLYQASQAFFAHIQKNGTLRNLLDRYYGHIERLRPVDVTDFLSNIQTVLPKYRKFFKLAQDKTDLDWRLLAAISYQESHWDNYSTSPTNVRGMMMLTEETADHMGVTDRLDPKQSIIAGAKYILEMKDYVPVDIPEPDRTWMALASYNIGYAHVEDARELAKKMNLNPNSWADIKHTLPLLNKPQYFSGAKHGYARGGAPVIFAESVRTYLSILEKHEPLDDTSFANFNINASAGSAKPRASTSH